MGIYTDRLKKMSKKMAEQQKDYVPGGVQSVPDAEYNFRVRAVIDEWAAKDDKPARLYVGFVFVIDEGEYEGRSIKNSCGLEDRVSSQICRGILEDFGYEWPADDLTKLEEIVADITERAPLVVGTTKTRPQKNNPEYFNTSIKITEVLEPAGQIPDDQAQDEGGGEAEQGEAPADEPGNDDKTELLDFAASQGIDGFSDDNELDDMVEALKEAGLDPIEPDTLTDEEKALLERLGLSDVLIAKPKAKAKVVVPTKSAKPVIKGKGKK